jgi:hypothetical protein
LSSRSLNRPITIEPTNHNWASINQSHFCFWHQNRASLVNQIVAVSRKITSSCYIILLHLYLYFFFQDLCYQLKLIFHQQLIRFFLLISKLVFATHYLYNCKLFVWYITICFMFNNIWRQDYWPTNQNWAFINQPDFFFWHQNRTFATHYSLNDSHCI